MFPLDNIGPDDLCHVQGAIYSIHHKWYNIGLQLHISFPVLDGMKANNRTTDECLTEMLKHWLNCDPSWSDLVQALSSEPVGEKTLARQIHTKYCSTPRDVDGTQRYVLRNTDSPSNTTPQQSATHEVHDQRKTSVCEERDFLPKDEIISQMDSLETEFET